MSDEEFLDLVADLGVQVLPLFRKPIPQGHIDNLFKRLDAEKPFLRELTDTEMQLLLLSMLEKWPSEGYHLEDKLDKMNCTFKDNSKATPHGLLRKLKRRGLITHEVNTIGDREEDVYKLTKPRRQALRKTIDRFPAFARWVRELLASTCLSKRPRAKHGALGRSPEGDKQFVNDCAGA
jgi:DNA-binding PadR family transcriptional regulator